MTDSGTCAQQLTLQEQLTAGGQDRLDTPLTRANRLWPQTRTNDGGGGLGTAPAAVVTRECPPFRQDRQQAASGTWDVIRVEDLFTEGVLTDFRTNPCTCHSGSEKWTDWCTGCVAGGISTPPFAPAHCWRTRTVGLCPAVTYDGSTAQKRGKQNTHRTQETRDTSP